MLTVFCGIPAYLTAHNVMIDTTRAEAVEIAENVKLRVLPFDNTPPFFWEIGEADTVYYPDCRLVRVPPSPLSYAAPRVVKLIHNAEGTHFTVTQNAVESDDGLYASLPPHLTEPKLRAAKHLGGLTLALNARQGGDQYLFVAVKEQHEWSVRIDTLCASVQQRNGATLVLTDLSPAGLIGKVSVYDSAFRLAENYTVYTSKRLTEDPVLLLADYLQLGMTQEARALLSADLLTDTSFDEIAAFFSSYRRVELTHGVNGCYAFFKDANHADLFRAVYRDGFIDDLDETTYQNINRIDTESPLNP